MRVAWLVVGACSGTAAQPAQPIASPQARALMAAASDVRPIAYRARVGTERGPRADIFALDPGTGGWVDIIADGTDDDARWLCEQVANAEQRRHARIHAINVEFGKRPTSNIPRVRECSLEPLPPAQGGPVLLVASTTLDQHDAWMINAGTDGPADARRERSATGTVIRSTPFRDRATCEVMLARLDTADERDRTETQQTKNAFTERQIAQAREQEATACEALTAALQACTKRKEQARAQCELDAQPARAECELWTQARHSYEARRGEPIERKREQRFCHVL
jgi:hypothetical protein